MQLETPARRAGFSQLDLVLVGAGISAAILSAACLILYAGLGIIYGSYVGLTDRVADMQFVSAKMSRLLMTSGALQLPLAGVVWILFTRHKVSVGARIFGTVATVLATQVVAVGTTFVLGQLGAQPVTELVRWLDSSVGKGLR